MARQCSEMEAACKIRKSLIIFTTTIEGCSVWAKSQASGMSTVSVMDMKGKKI